MQQIYLDNASTSFPKPREVSDAVYHYMMGMGSNIGRGGYASAYAAEEAVFAARQLLCNFFGGEDPKNVVFTKNITEALNVLLRGLLQPGDHVLVSAMEHNAVMRPLQLLGHELAADEQPSDTITFSRVPCDREGNLELEYLPKLVRPNTKAIVMTHASNVCGTLLPLTEVGAFCKEHNLLLIVDSAQSAGLFPIHMQSLGIDALAFTGHKGLLGPQGMGGFILREHMVEQVLPLIVGGTGSLSHTERTPTFMPDKFEAGTLNLPGIMGLAAGVRWLHERGLDNIRNHELALTEQLLAGLLALEQQGFLRIVGRKDVKQRTSVVSIADTTLDIAMVAHKLAAEYGIATRVGLHCAPNAHKTLGTYSTGTLRFSMGWHNSAADIATALAALEEVLRHGV
ncbi:MAG: aminotransferase class V-fold PLP-dependent enzyme [Phascolarctobacterium sp.]|nr:aminotransferase class V-fold PLP-dependent enzyme [Phascolarctobacterium sp.]